MNPTTGPCASSSANRPGSAPASAPGGPSHDVRIRPEDVKRLDHPEAGRPETTFRRLNPPRTRPLPRRAVHDLIIHTAEPGTPAEDRLKLLAPVDARKEAAGS
ncbi:MULTISPECIES: hypothetical protein [unclassified Streptomyces]|uniref:MmyB family transcriptional regulator n=1 Tax=unclassified Streptomyces TaxID=2593676 RepID=UPI0031FC700D